MAELEELLAARGFDSFREARHPFDLTQRQAAGRFTVAEAEELLERLQSDGDDVPVAAAPPTVATAAAPPSDRQRRRQEELVVDLDADVLATELTNRGWCCIPPP